MPEESLLWQALAVSAGLTAALMLAVRLACPSCAPLTALFAVLLSSLAGAWLLGVRPRWPMEDQHRLLLVLLPATVAVECLAFLARKRWWLLWLPRLVVAIGAARVLLHDTTYVADLSGPGTHEWPAPLAIAILAALGLALLAEWFVLDLLARRTRGVDVGLSLALSCAAAGFMLMLSGYLSGGRLILPLAVALVLAVVLAPRSAQPHGLISLGVVVLFAILILGRFLSDLRPMNAVLLFLAPLLGWLPEVPSARKLRPWLRGTLGLLCVLVLLGILLMRAKALHDKQSGPSSRPGEESPQDYLDFESR